MKFILLLFSFLVYSQSSAQKLTTTFLDKNFNETLRDSAAYYRVAFVVEGNIKNGPEKVYRMDGSLLWEGVYNNNRSVGLFTYYYSNGSKSEEKYYENGTPTQLSKWYLNGLLIEESEYVERQKRIINSWDSSGVEGVIDGSGSYNSYHQDGGISEFGSFVNFNRVGRWIGYHENGKNYYLEEYADGELISGISFDDFGNRYEYDVITKNETNYEAFYRAVGQKLRYPAEARKYGIQGKVYVQFLVDVKGFILPRL